MRKGFLRLTIALATLALGVTGLAAAGFGQAGADGVASPRFVLTADGFGSATFSELSGIKTEVEVADYSESGTGDVMLRKNAGTIKPPDITLRRAMNNQFGLWTWHREARNGAAGAGRRNCSLTIHSADGTVVGRYLLMNAWPSKIQIGAIKAGSADAPVETVTFTAETVERVAP